MSADARPLALVERLGAFVANLTYEDLPAEAVDTLKLRVLDLMGAAIPGIQSDTYRPFYGAHADGKSVCWATGEQMSVRDAAFLNSFVAHAAYMEDGSRFCGGHPASVVIPATIALADQTGASGREVLAAVAAGYEVFLRVGRAVYPAIVQRGMQSTAVLGGLGAAAASSSLMRLDATQAANALAISASLGFGLKEALRSSSSQPVQVARACEGGVLAAMAATRGAPGARRILEEGLLPLCGGTADAASVTEDLGARFCASETYIKIHGGCRGNHAPIDLVTCLLADAGVGPEAIAAISMRVDSVTHTADIDEPTTPEQAQFSARFAIAVKLLRGDALPHQYNPEALAAHDVRTMMQRITIAPDQELDVAYPDQRGARATIRLHDGQELTGMINNARGEPEIPLDQSEIESKFLALSDSWLDGNADELRELLLSLEAQESIADVSHIMSRAAIKALDSEYPLEDKRHVRVGQDL